MITYKHPRYIGSELFTRAYSVMEGTSVGEDEKFLLCDTICALKELEPSLNEEILIQRASTLKGIYSLDEEFARENKNAKALCNTRLREIMLSPNLDENEKLTSLLHEYIHLLGKENGLEGVSSTYINEITVQRISYDVSQLLKIENSYYKTYPNGLSYESYGKGYDMLNPVSETLFDMFGRTQVYKSLLDENSLNAEDYKKEYVDVLGKEMEQMANSPSSTSNILRTLDLKLRALPEIMEDREWNMQDYFALSRKYQRLSPYFSQGANVFQPAEGLIANDAIFLAKLHGINTSLVSKEFDIETQSTEMAINSAALSLLRRNGVYEDFTKEDLKSAVVSYKKSDRGFLICLDIGGERFTGCLNNAQIDGEYLSSVVGANFEVKDFTVQPLIPPIREPVREVNNDMVQAGTLIYHKHFSELNDSTKKLLNLIDKDEYISNFEIQDIGKAEFEKFLRIGFADKIFASQENFNYMSNTEFENGNTILSVASMTKPNNRAFNCIVETIRDGELPKGIEANMINSETGQCLVDAILTEMGEDDRALGIERNCTTEEYMMRKRDKLYQILDSVVEAGGHFTSDSIELIRKNGDMQTVMLAAKHGVPLKDLLKGSNLKVFVQNNEPVACGYIGASGQYEIIHRLSLPPRNANIISDAMNVIEKYGGEIICVKQGLLSGHFEIDGETYKYKKGDLTPKEIESVLKTSWSRNIERELPQSPDFMVESKGHFYLIALSDSGDLAFKKEVPAFTGSEFGATHIQYSRSINYLQYDRQVLDQLSDMKKENTLEK